MRLSQLLEAMLECLDFPGQGIICRNILRSVALPAPLSTPLYLSGLLSDHSEACELLILVVGMRRHNLVSLRQEEVILLLPPTG